MSRSSIVVNLDDKSYFIDLEECIFTFDSVHRRDKDKNYSYSFDVDSILVPKLGMKDCIADGTFIKVKDLPHEEARIVCDFFGMNLFNGCNAISKWNVVGQCSYALSYLWEGIQQFNPLTRIDMNAAWLKTHYEYDNSLPLILIKYLDPAYDFGSLGKVYTSPKKVVAVMPKALKAAIPYSIFNNKHSIFLSRYGISQAFDGWKDDSYARCIMSSYISMTQSKIRNLLLADAK